MRESGLAGESSKQWHMEKSVSVSHILTTIGMVVVLAAGWNSLTARLAVVESQQTAFNERVLSMLQEKRRIDDRQDREIATIYSHARDDYRTINEKLDQLVNESSLRGRAGNER